MSIIEDLFFLSPHLRFYHFMSPKQNCVTMQTAIIELHRSLLGSIYSNSLAVFSLLLQVTLNRRIEEYFLKTLSIFLNLVKFGLNLFWWFYL